MRVFLLLILFNLSCCNYAFSQKINIEGNKYLMSFFFSLYFTFKLRPTKKGKSNDKCKFINLYISSNINIFFKNNKYNINIGE